MKRLYVVVRSDLTPGLQIAQACHAAHEYGRSGTEDVGDNLVVLSAPVEKLLEVVHTAATGGLSYVAFHEPDLGGEITAAAFPGEARAILSCLPLALRH